MMSSKKIRSAAMCITLLNNIQRNIVGRRQFGVFKWSMVEGGYTFMGGNCFFTDEISDLKGLLHFEMPLLNNSPE